MKRGFMKRGLSQLTRTAMKWKPPRRVTKKPTGQATSDRARLKAVHYLPCVLCARLGVEQQHRTQAHHIRTGYGMGERAPDTETIALCGSFQAGCHSGDHGIHGDRSLLKRAGVTELDLLADTNRLLTTRSI